MERPSVIRVVLARGLPFVVLACVIASLVAGRAIRREMGFEASVEFVQSWVAALGWRAPAAYVALVTLRLFLLLPSAIVLSAGGLVFGTLQATMLGGTGIVLSALIGFAAARGMGNAWLRPRVRLAYETEADRARSVGPVLVGLATAHPIGPMSAFHWGAGLARVPWIAFIVAVAVGGLARAFTLSFFGSTLADVRSWRFLGATAFLLLVALVPALHPGVRRRILRAPRVRSS